MKQLLERMLVQQKALAESQLQDRVSALVYLDMDDFAQALEYAPNCQALRDCYQIQAELKQTIPELRHELKLQATMLAGAAGAEVSTIADIQEYIDLGCYDEALKMLTHIPRTKHVTELLVLLKKVEA